jgi:hypothetical protein
VNGKDEALDETTHGASNADDIMSGSVPPGKKSRMSATLLSNFILGITLLKNISMKFSNPEQLEDDYQ